eukprot:318615_1
MAVRKLFLLNTYAFLALQSRGANIDYYVTKTTSARNNCNDCSQPCATLWDAIGNSAAIPSPFKLTNVSHNLNNWLQHGLCSESYSNQYIMVNIHTDSCSESSDAFVENEVHSLHNEFKDTQPTSDRNSTILNAKSLSQNRISLRIVNKHETINTVHYASGTEQHMRG